ncbi:ATP synthase F1 subunit gamma [Buchnera aphidicola]|uniref:ATP synthase F1 subunit gamma n=1 Tax=Buchnera aphidicola TaxID=9 RepID=UPI00346462E5
MINTNMIRNKIKSISNTKKITKTMEMVAITKIKKMQNKILISQPYLNSIKEIIFHFLQGKLKKNIFLKKKKQIKSIGIVVVSSNRGLCGSLNNNIFKIVNSVMKNNTNHNIKFFLYILGKRGSLFFKNQNIHHNYKTIFLDDELEYTDLIPLAKKLIIHYKKNIFDKLLIVSNKFYSRILQKPEIFQILPIHKKNFSGPKYTIYKNWDYLYEYYEKYTIEYVLNEYIIFQLLQLLLENQLSEQSARMIAMKTATDNSKNIITDLRILYNKIRQFSITQELIEIISGANICL